MLNNRTLTLLFVTVGSIAAQAATIVVPNGSTVLTSWSFEPANISSASGTTSSAGAADIGIVTATSGSNATSVHAASAAYTFVSGNGSAKAFNSNTWAIGDYYQFSLNSTGFSNIFVNFGQAGSSTGPRDFKLSYSTNGTTFTDFASYPVNAGSFSTNSFSTANLLSFDLSSVTALNSAGSLTFRLIDTSTVSIANGVVGTGGTDRVDDFTVSSGPVTLVSSVPEPATVVSLLGGLGLLCGFRRVRDRRSAVRR